MNDILTIDVANHHTALAAWSGDTAQSHWQIASDPARTVDELRLLVAELLAHDGPRPAEVAGSVLGCVVPALIPTFVEVCRALFGASPLVVGPGVRSGLAVRTEDPREVGADRIANAVAAVARFGAPVIVLDGSTALTLDVVDASGAYCGAIIAPGPEAAAEALSARTARLPNVPLDAPPTAIGRDTTTGLQSGLYFGYIGLIEGLIRRVRAEVGPAPVVATGEAPGLAKLVGACPSIASYEPLLTLDGLRRIYLAHHART